MDTNHNESMEILLKCQAALNAAIALAEAAEIHRQSAEKARLCLVIGTAVVDHADELPEGKFSITEFLDHVVTDIPTRLLLAKWGWL